MRKDAGFEVVDRINVYFTTDSENVVKAFNGPALKNVVLADNIVRGSHDGFTKELDVNGEVVIVTVEKIK